MIPVFYIEFSSTPVTVMKYTR